MAVFGGAARFRPRADGARPARSAWGLLAPRGTLLAPAGVLLALVGALWFCSGCNREAAAGPVALEVGTRQIRLPELQGAWREFARSDTALAADSTRLNRFLEGYEGKVLLEVMARDSIPALEGMPKQNLADFQERAMVEALRKKSYGKAYEVSRKELDEAYASLGRELHLGYIGAKDAPEASQIVEALREGAVFDKVARTRSLDERSRENGGDVGWITYTDLDVPIRQRVFSLKVGEVGGPYESSGRFQIFKVLEERPNARRRPLEQERQMLELGLTAERVRKAGRQYQEDLLRKYHFKLDPVEVTWMTVLLKEKTAGIKRGVTAEELQDPLSSELEEIDKKPPFTEPPVALADTGRVLATFDPPEGRVTPLLVLDQLVSDPALAWPTFDSGKDVENLIRALVLERLEIREARARGMDKLPEVVAATTREETEIRRRVFYRTRVRFRARPTEEVAKAYYDAHPEEFREPEQRRFIAVNSASWDNAVRASELLRAGKSLQEVVAAFAGKDTTFKATTEQGTRLLTYGKSPLLDPFLFRLPLNGVSDPIPVGQAFTVGKVVEIRPERVKPFSDVKIAIQSKIGGARADSILKLIVAEGRKTYPIEVHWDVVRSMLRT